MRKVLFLSLLLTLAMSLMSLSAFADTYQYEFDGSNQQGTITPNLGFTQFVGAGIDIDSLFIDDLTTGLNCVSVGNCTSLFSVLLPVNSGMLSFDTSAGTFAIDGTAPGTGIGNGTTLVSGLLSGAPSLTGCGALDKMCDVNFYAGSSTLGGVIDLQVDSQAGSGAKGGPWTPDSNDVTLVAPEPSSLALLGSGLAFVGGSLRRRLAGK